MRCSRQATARAGEEDNGTDPCRARLQPGVCYTNTAVFEDAQAWTGFSSIAVPGSDGGEASVDPPSIGRIGDDEERLQEERTAFRLDFSAAAVLLLGGSPVRPTFDASSTAVAVGFAAPLSFPGITAS